MLCLPLPAIPMGCTGVIEFARTAIAMRSLRGDAVKTNYSRFIAYSDATDHQQQRSTSDWESWKGEYGLSDVSSITACVMTCSATYMNLEICK